MPRAKKPDRKIPFSTRISPATLDQLDKLVRWGSYPNRTSALEAAVERLVNDAEEILRQRRRAVEETAGSISVRITPASMREGHDEYNEWLADRLLGRRPGG